MSAENLRAARNKLAEFALAAAEASPADRVRYGTAFKRALDHARGEVERLEAAAPPRHEDVTPRERSLIEATVEFVERRITETLAERDPPQPQAIPRPAIPRFF